MQGFLAVAVLAVTGPRCHWPNYDCRFAFVGCFGCIGSTRTRHECVSIVCIVYIWEEEDDDDDDDDVDVDGGGGGGDDSE
ncbi:hypothetical protein BLOT_012308 [Blomia tropicalis]|nr:hypothetical protein BLOT_012308 [Blomia tropicalis]